MSFKANPQQALLLFSMLFGETLEEREPLQSKTHIKDAKVRNALVKAGLMRKERRKGKRGEFLVLTDDAWDWAVSNLNTPLAKSQAAAFALQNVLGKLQRFLTMNDHALVEFVRGDSPSSEQRATVDTPKAVHTKEPRVVPPDLEARVREACLNLAQGHTKQRIRLTDLRREVHAPREVVDQALTAMQNSGKLVLMRLDNPAELTQEDDAAALSIAGNPRHLVYLEA